MASPGEVGIDIDVAQVPLREPDMEPFEIMVSESQERMLCVVEPAGSTRCWRSCRSGRWAGTVIGEVTADGRIRIFDGEELVGDMPVPARRRLPALRPRAGRAGGVDLRQTPRGWPRTPATMPRRACSPCSPRPRRLQALGLRAVRLDRRLAHGAAHRSGRRGGAPAVPETGTAIAVSIDGNGRRVACDPYAGTVEAVLECAQNLACVGAEPLGLTNCLNFGNPEKPHSRLAAHPLGRGTPRRLHGARRAGGGRQRLALQREPSGADLPHAGRGHGRRAPDAERGCRVRLHGGGRRDRLCRAVRALAGRLGARQAARRAGRGLPGRSMSSARRGRIAAVREAVRAGAVPPPTTSPTAAWPARWPSLHRRRLGAGWTSLRCSRRAGSGETRALRRGSRRLRARAAESRARWGRSAGDGVRHDAADGEGDSRSRSAAGAAATLRGGTPAAFAERSAAVASLDRTSLEHADRRAGIGGPLRASRGRQSALRSLDHAPRDRDRLDAADRAACDTR